MKISSCRARSAPKENWYAAQLKFRRYYTVGALLRRIERGETGKGDAIFLLHVLRVKDAKIEAGQERIRNLLDMLGYRNV